MSALIVGAIIVRCICILILQLLHEWQAPVHGDATIYFAVARGILNGLTPYRDLFETKPPGIFLLFAASLRWTNGSALALVVEIVAITGVMLVLPIFCWRKKLRPSLMLLASVIGVFFAEYVMSESGGLLAELYGAFFATLYVLTIAWKERFGGWLQIFLASFFMLLSIGMKEPFMLSMAGAAILFARDIRFFLHAFILPFCIAAVTGLLTASVLGYLDPLVTFYFPYMLGEHVQRFGPLWKRGLLFDYFFVHMTKAAPFLPFIFGTLWIGQFAANKRWNEKIQTFVAIGIALLMFVGYLLIHHVRILQPLWGNPSYIGAVRWSLPVLIAAPLILLWLIWMLEHKAHIKVFAHHLILHLALLYLLVLTVGLGGEFYWHHYVFAVPFYIALSIRFLHIYQSKRTQVLTYGIIAITAFALAVIPLPIYRSSDQLAAQKLQLQQTALLFDAALTRCGLDRYLPIGDLAGSELWPYSVISPLGPAIFHYDVQIDPKHVYFYGNFMRNLQNAQVLLVKDSLLEKERNETVNTIIKNDFTETIPPCAQTLPHLNGLRLYFRK
jgi:hypothetical protein